MRAALVGFDASLLAFHEAANGIADELASLAIDLSSSPGAPERIAAAADRMAGVIHAISVRFPTYQTTP